MDHDIWYGYSWSWLGRGTKMWTTSYDMGIPGPGLGQAQKCGKVKPINGIQPSWYCITGNFCGFGLKRRHLIFVEFVFCRLKILAPKFLFGITGSNNWSDVAISNWCTLQWSFEVKTYLVLWKIFKGYSFWIRIWLTSNLS